MEKQELQQIDREMQSFNRDGRSVYEIELRWLQSVGAIVLRDDLSYAVCIDKYKTQITRLEEYVNWQRKIGYAKMEADQSIFQTYIPEFIKKLRITTLKQ